MSTNQPPNFPTHSQDPIPANQPQTSLSQEQDPLAGASAYYRGIYQSSFDSMYPVEAYQPYAENGPKFKPIIGEIVNFRPNPALSAGTSAMTSGRWRKGMVMAITNHPSRGSMISVRDDVTNHVYKLHCSQVRKNII